MRYSIILFGTLAALFWLSTAQQPLIDQHEFRQTQTALTALFLQPGPNGFLNYQTPVLGYPWSIPFEFPFYQWLASLPARFLPISLSTSGRLISILFGLACLWPALGIMKRFDISRNGQQIFVILYLTSSIYLYWNRSFMIESTALFMTLLALYNYTAIRPLPHYDESIKPRHIRWHYAALFLTLSLGLLIKATTALPAFLLIGADVLTQAIRSLRAPFSKKQAIHLLIIALSLAISFLLLRTWTHHADSLKQLNPIGKYITSKELFSWNFGPLSQRFSPELWDTVLLQRMLTPWGALPALGLLIYGFLGQSKGDNHKLFNAACLFMALSPLLIFTNLHIQHNYYQSANQIYLLAALASSGSQALRPHKQTGTKIVASALLIAFAVSNLAAFKTTTHYFDAAFEKESVKRDIGRLVATRTPPESVLLVFDDDWSSAFAFHGGRRTLAVPDWFQDIENREALLSGPTEWLGGHPLGAVITRELLSSREEAALQSRCTSPALMRFPEWNLYLCQATAHGGSDEIPAS